MELISNQTYDLLIILGDMGYDINDEYGN